MEQHYLPLNREVISIDQASKYFDLPKSDFEKLISNREIPYYEPIEKRYFLKIKEVDSWITANRFDTNAEMKAKKMGIENTKNVFG